MMPRRPNFLIVMIPLALALAPAACGDSPSAPAYAAERSVYALRSMAGQQLPAVATTSPGARFTFRADTITLESDGRGTQVTRVLVETDQAAPMEERWVAHFRYELRGDRFTVSFVCPPDPISSCVAPPHLAGRLAGASLRLDRALGYPVPMVYERVAAGG